MATLDTLYAKKIRDDIRVKKTFTAPLSALYVEDSFNIRFADITAESVENLIEAYRNDAPVPPIVVEVQDDNRLKIIAGHRRFKAISTLLAETLDDKYSRVEVRGWTVEDTEKTIVYMVGENGHGAVNLNAVDLSIACQKLSDLGNSAARIAELLNFSEPKVVYHLTIAKMCDEVKQAIVAGNIAADFAAELFRKGGDEAVLAVLNKASGAKATRSNSGCWRPSMGKSVVSVLSEAECYDDGKGGVTVYLDAEAWSKVQEAMNALKGGV